jgi:hypothetical protein
MPARRTRLAGTRGRPLRITHQDAFTIAAAIERRVSGRADLVAALKLEALPAFGKRLLKAARRKRATNEGPHSEITIAEVPEIEASAADLLVRGLLLVAPGALLEDEVDAFCNLQVALLERKPSRGRRPVPYEELKARVEGRGGAFGDEESRSRMVQRYRAQLRVADHTGAELAAQVEKVGYGASVNFLRLLSVVDFK